MNHYKKLHFCWFSYLIHKIYVWKKMCISGTFSCNFSCLNQDYMLLHYIYTFLKNNFREEILKLKKIRCSKVQAKQIHLFYEAKIENSFIMLKLIKIPFLIKKDFNVSIHLIPSYVYHSCSTGCIFDLVC